VLQRETSYSELKSFCQHELDLAKEEDNVCFSCAAMRQQMDAMLVQNADSTRQQLQGHEQSTMDMDALRAAVADMKRQLEDCQQVLSAERQKQVESDIEKVSEELRY
jgi:hypothetical protein